MFAYMNFQSNRNAFTLELIRKIKSINCNDIETIIFSNRGPVFSSGLDLRVFLQGVEEARRYLAELNDMVHKLLDCEANTMAYMTGDAYGFGVEFTYFVDYVAASRSDLILSLQGIKLGVFPPYTYMLADVLGHETVRLLLARPIYAEEARRIGLVHHIGGLDDALSRLFKAPRHVFPYAKAHRRLVKDALRRADAVLEELAGLAGREETTSLIRSFLEKR
ncbi:MAG: enoyl-CoA hydratase/isomerase family protein [Thermoproteus sp.]